MKSIKKTIKKNKILYPLFSGIKNYKLNKLKRYYDTLFSNVIKGDLIVKFNNIDGDYEIDARSDILERALLRKEYEPDIVKLVHEKTNPEMDAINIGSNIGLYATILASYINSNQKVLAIEPTPNAFRLLKRNIERNNKSDQIITFNGIAASKKDEFSINLIEGKEEYSSIGNLVHSSISKDTKTVVKVNGNTIDNLVEKHKIKPGIIVMDVEGSEFEVLKGSINTLKKFRPVIITEIDDLLLKEQKTNSDEIINFLEAIGYSINDLSNENINYPFTGNIIAQPTEQKT